MKILACQRCKRQWDVSGYDVGQKLRCICNLVFEVPPDQSYSPDVRHCQICGASRRPGAAPCPSCGAVAVGEAVDLSMVCPYCLRRTPKESKFCASCAETLNPGRLDAKASGLCCPRCLTPKLWNRKIGSFLVDECPSCSGMWVETKAFDGVVREQAERGEEESRPKRPVRSKLDENQIRVVYLKCPVCGRHMNRRNFLRASGVILDECRPDGVWLDCDELGKVGAYLASGGRDYSRELVQREEGQTRPIPMEPQSGILHPPLHTAGGGQRLGSILSFIEGLLDGATPR